MTRKTKKTAKKISRKQQRAPKIVTVLFSGVLPDKVKGAIRVARRVTVLFNKDQYAMIDQARFKLNGLVEACTFPTWIMPKELQALKISALARSVAANAGPEELEAAA